MFICFWQILQQWLLWKSRRNKHKRNELTRGGLLIWNRFSIKRDSHHLPHLLLLSPHWDDDAPNPNASHQWRWILPSWVNCFINYTKIIGLNFVTESKFYSTSWSALWSSCEQQALWIFERFINEFCRIIEFSSINLRFWVHLFVSAEENLSLSMIKNK